LETVTPTLVDAVVGVVAGGLTLVGVVIFGRVKGLFAKK